MIKKLKITFKRGGTVYARLLTEEAPKTVKLMLDSLPRTDKMRQANVGGSTMFIDSGFGTAEKENVIQKKQPGQVTLSLNSPSFAGKAIRIFYSFDERVGTDEEENLFAVIEKESMTLLESIGRSIWLEGSEMATFEVCEG